MFGLCLWVLGHVLICLGISLGLFNRLEAFICILGWEVLAHLSVLASECLRLSQSVLRQADAFWGVGCVR